jgi:mRNA interferase ChpB
MKGPHYGLVISQKAFNLRGLAMICPISQGAAASSRTFGTVVTLMGLGIDTQGAVHCHQVKSLDWKLRKVRFKEKIPKDLVDDIAMRIEAIIFE